MLQDSVLVWGEVPKVTVPIGVQASPVGVEAETDKLTVPASPLTAIRVIVEVPERPGYFWDGLTAPADMVKSVTVKVTVVVWDPAEVLVPLTITA